MCAGIILAREAGAKVYSRRGAEFQADDLMGRHFCVVRAIGDTSSEKGQDAQDRIAKQFFDAAEDWDV